MRSINYEEPDEHRWAESSRSYNCTNWTRIGSGNLLAYKGFQLWTPEFKSDLGPKVNEFGALEWKLTWHKVRGFQVKTEDFLIGSQRLLLVMLLINLILSEPFIAEWLHSEYPAHAEELEPE